MQPRINPYQAAPEAMTAMGALESYVQICGLEASLIDLVKTRASQINGWIAISFRSVHPVRTAGAAA